MDNDESIESMWKREADAASPDAVSNVPEESEEARAERVRIWRGLALPALVLGLLATILVYGNPASVTMPLFVIAVIAFFRHVMRLSGIQKPKRGSIFCFAVMLLLALSDCLTDNAFIITCNNIGICLVLAVALLHNFCDDRLWRLGTYFARMIRYIGHYGQLTFLRVLVLWTLAVLALLLAGQAAQVFSRRFPLFRYGFAVTCACYAALSLARPDYWIADYNLAHIGQDRTELTYRGISDLRNLANNTSCDAAPAFERAGMLRVDFACDALGRHVAESFDYRDVLREKLGDKPLTPRSWNFSRARARRIVQE